MDIVIKINLDNAAFEEARNFEIKRILDTIRFYDGQRLVDVNGHTVGLVTFEETKQ